MKCKKYNIEPKTIKEINDIAGIRVIALFQRDIETVCGVINDNFTVTRMEDTGQRLSENQFGYGSIHFEVTPRKEWLQVPTLQRLEGLSLEIQVRTASQHIWAAASHKLQYKQESHVPPPLRRSINRTAALLEMVDLEFERLLNERHEYMEEINTSEDKTELNVEILREVLDNFFPSKNKDDFEDYGDLLTDITYVNIKTKGELTNILNKHYSKVMENDRMTAWEYWMEYKNTGEIDGNEIERLERGVYFTHVGLTREAFEMEFGKNWRKFEPLLL